MNSRLVLPVVLALTILGSLGLSAGTASLASSSGAEPTANLQTLNLMNFGAVGNGVADDGPALQAALDALAAAGGGTLIVPSGKYAIITPVKKDFNNVASITIIGAEPTPVPENQGFGRGLGLSSEFHVRVGETKVALEISEIQNLLMQDIAFIGNPAVINDAKNTLRLLEIDNATVRHCEFYGLASMERGGDLLFAYESNLKVEDSAFLGCATASSYNASMIQNISWYGITVTGTRFIDYGTRANFFSKTPYAPPFSWISIGNPAPIDAANSRREVVLRDLFLDEGAFIGISAIPSFFSLNPGPINLIFISDIFMNASNLGAHGLLLDSTQRVFMERSLVGWSHNADTGINLSSVGEAILDQDEFVEHAYRIRAAASTGRLTVVNSTYQDLDSQAQVTEVVNTSIADDPVQYVRQQYLTVLGHEPDPSGYFYWSSRILRCGQDATCAQETRDALANYLGGNPSERFTLSGKVAESSGQAIGGATVTLSGSGTATTQTDAAGNYSFGNLPTGGSYTVTVAKNKFVFSEPSKTVTTPDGDSVLNFTGAPVTYSIIGRVATPEGAGVQGANVNLTGVQTATVVTDDNGMYRLDNVRSEGTHTITVQRINYDFLPASTTINGLVENQIIHFTAIVRSFTISGNAGMPDVNVTLSGMANATTKTNAQGNYSFTVNAEVNCTVSASTQNFSFNPGNYSFTNLDGNKVANFSAIANPRTISGSIGVPGVTVTISGSSGWSVITGDAGIYSFVVNAGGNYSVSANKAHYNISPASHSFNGLSQDVTADFQATLNTYTISGNAGIPGVEVRWQGDASGVVTSGAGGVYSIPLLALGNYTVTATKAHYTFTPPSMIFNSLSGNQTLNFTPTISTHTLSGTTGLSGVTLTLSGDASATQVTGAGGNYSFTVNGGGTYTVTPSRPHHVFAPTNLFVTNLSNNVTANFVGTHLTHTISGTTGVAGITVSLSGSSTGAVTTPAGGGYSFTVLGGGNYTVTAQHPAYAFAPPSYAFTNLGASQTANFAGALRPILLTEPNSDLAIALSSVQFLRGPFSVVNPRLFGTDQRTRVMFFAENAKLLPGETVSVVTAEAIDSQQRTYPLTVEYVGDVPLTPNLSQINIKLSDALIGLSSVQVKIRVRGVESINQVRIGLIP